MRSLYSSGKSPTHAFSREMNTSKKKSGGVSSTKEKKGLMRLLCIFWMESGGTLLFFIACRVPTGRFFILLSLYILVQGGGNGVRIVVVIVVVFVVFSSRSNVMLNGRDGDGDGIRGRKSCRSYWVWLGCSTGGVFFPLNNYGRSFDIPCSAESWTFFCCNYLLFCLSPSTANVCFFFYS